MATSKDFSDYYKKISDTELLAIFDNPDNYQPLAINAAKEEFANRKLSETDIEKARQPLDAVKVQKEKEREKVEKIETKIKAVGNTFFDTINPIQSGTPSAEKTIRFIIIIFVGLFLYQVFRDLSMFKLMMNDISNFDASSFFYFLPFVIMPAAIIFFWMRKKIGWILLVFFVTYSGIGILWMFFQIFRKHFSGSAAFDSIILRSPPISFLFQFLFFAGTLYVICKSDIKEIFKIEKQMLLATVIVSLLFTLILLFGIS